MCLSMQHYSAFMHKKMAAIIIMVCTAHRCFPGGNSMVHKYF